MKEQSVLLNDARRVITLKQCEAIIQEGLESMYKVDRALSIINDMALYKRKNESFESYCQARWNISEKHNYIFIKGLQKEPALPVPQNNITRRIYESRK